MELFQVRYFLALARTLNFTRAAEACNVSQPALTRAIQRLEEELGGPLLHRERNLTQLTSLGRAMLPHLEAAHGAAETAAAQAMAFRSRECEPLRLGIDQSLSAQILTPALGELQARMRGFECGLAEGASADLLQLMMEGALDSAVLIDPAKPPERLDRWRLFRDGYVVLCPEHHHLAGLAEIPITALAEECLVARGEKASDFDQALVRLCAAAGLTPRPRHRCASEEQIRQMVAAGLGIALGGQHRAPCPGIVARPLTDPEAGRNIVLAAVAGRPHSPALAAFLKLMRARDWQAAAAQLSKP
jgi:DNA-binding transcriptional LysR family regulator